MKDDRLYLIHMRECGDRIEQYVTGGRDTIMHSTLIQDAVLRNLQTPGQSVGRLSDVLRNAPPEVDWRGIIGLRNTLVHDYFGISLVRIWAIVEHDLPDLRQKVEVLIQELEATFSDSEGKEGDVGTVVELLPPDGVEVEFLDRAGRTRCLATLSVDDVLTLNRERLQLDKER